MPCVSYPGAPGAFSHQAALAAFPAGFTLLPFESWEDAARAIVDGQCLKGVFPIDNSLAGEVPLTRELLSRYALRVVAEQSLPIRQHLLGLPGAALENIRSITSHPHAIKQCEDFLAAHPAIRVFPSQSTALSARLVAQSGDLTLAAIGALAARDAYGLCILKQNIQSSDDNFTRFVIVEKEGG